MALRIAPSSFAVVLAHSALLSPGPIGQAAAEGLPPPLDGVGVGTGVGVGLLPVEPEGVLLPPPQERVPRPSTADTRIERSSELDDTRLADGLECTLTDIAPPVTEPASATGRPPWLDDFRP